MKKLKGSNDWSSAVFCNHIRTPEKKRLKATQKIPIDKTGNNHLYITPLLYR